MPEIKPPKVGDKVKRTGESTPSVKKGGVYKVKGIRNDRFGITWIKVEGLMTSEKFFWKRFQPATVQLENK